MSSAVILAINGHQPKESEYSVSTALYALIILCTPYSFPSKNVLQHVSVLVSSKEQRTIACIVLDVASTFKQDAGFVTLNLQERVL